MKRFCRICCTPLIQFLDLGKQPIANNFLKDPKPDKEFFYRLKVGFCPVCHTVQLINVPKREDIFNKDYPFFTSTSKYMDLHFCKLANLIKSMDLPKRPFILEIGCNDGTFLKNFKDVRCLGIDPSLSVAKECWNKGIPIIVGFFDEGLANQILDSFGQADVIVTANVFPHIENRMSVLRGIKILLKPKGVWINEEPYLGCITNRIVYDQFYNEHIFYSSIGSFRNCIIFEDLDLQKFNFVPTHGGSCRYFVTHKNGKTKEWQDHIEYTINRENLNSIEPLENFARAVEKSKNEFLEVLRVTRGPIVGYGATAKSSTILNYCDIDSTKIEKIYDNTPEKQGKYSPGKHIPIASYDEFAKDNPGNVVLFAWNHAGEIFEKEKDKNINWIMPI